jgi:hypothetical protein
MNKSVAVSLQTALYVINGCYLLCMITFLIGYGIWSCLDYSKISEVWKFWTTIILTMVVVMSIDIGIMVILDKFAVKQKIVEQTNSMSDDDVVVVIISHMFGIMMIPVVILATPYVAKWYIALFVANPFIITSLTTIIFVLTRPLRRDIETGRTTVVVC